MCLIVVSETGNVIDLTDLEVAYNNNPDGAGVMWLQDERVHQLHTLPKTFAEVRDLAHHVAGYPHAMHLRYCTRGKVNTENCHPFSVLNIDDGDSNDLALMHNGTFQWITISDEQKKLDWSDTAAFAGRLQKNLREQAATSKLTIDHIFDSNVVERMSKRIQDWNKVVFLDNTGRWSYMNKAKGEIRKGMWYSNTYSLKTGYRDKQTAHHGPQSKSSYTWVSGSGTKTEVSSATSATKNDTKETYNYKRSAKAKYSFQRCPSMSNGVYMVIDDNTTTNYKLVDIETMRYVNSPNDRLGKSERKRLRNWLINEKKLADLKHEKKLASKITTDSQGRKIVTVAPKTEIITPNELNDDDDTIPLYRLANHFEKTYNA